MALRTGHGTGAGVPRIEVLPPDELPTPPVAAPVAAPLAAAERRPDGTLAPELARLLGRLGGLATVHGYDKYLQLAEEFMSEEQARLAALTGGELGPAPNSMVASAALQFAASRWAFDRAAGPRAPKGGRMAMFKLGSSLANDSRQNCGAAWEYAVREAAARPPAPEAYPWLAKGGDR